MPDELPNMPYYWLSFASSEKPQGEQFLGATIVEADTPVGAVRKAWNLGINPGGQVTIFRIPFDQYAELLRPEWIERLIPKDDLNAAGYFSKFNQGRMP
jgi:hypothetical protein